jgi:hypothetical protein
VAAAVCAGCRHRSTTACSTSPARDLVQPGCGGRTAALQDCGTGAEANLLKLAELRGRLTAEQEQRWAEVKQAYLREQALGGASDDPMTRAVGAVGLLADRVGDVEKAIRRAG